METSLLPLPDYKGALRIVLCLFVMVHLEDDAETTHYHKIFMHSSK